MRIASPLLRLLASSLSAPLLLACADERFDLLIAGGLLLDGNGAPAVREDLTVRGDLRSHGPPILVATRKQA